MVSDWSLEYLHLDSKDLIGQPIRREQRLFSRGEVVARFYFAIRDESNQLLLDHHLRRRTELQPEDRHRPKKLSYWSANHKI